MALGPDQYSSLIQAGAGTVNGIANIWGGNKAADAQKRANNNARNDLNAGYDTATGIQKPIYDTGLKNYTNLSDQYAGGNFANPHMDPYHFDPQQVFNDPEYQAQMRSGTAAINAGANAGSNLFSGQNQRDLTQFGQDTFAGRSDALYKRGFDATNTAFDQNAKSNLNNFNMGVSLMSPLAGSANQLTDLSVNKGADMANNDLVAGGIRAQNINNTTNGLTDINSNLANNGSAFFGGKQVRQPMSARKS